MSFCTLSSRLLRLDGSPLGFFPVEACLLPPGTAAYLSGLVLDPLSKTMSDAEGNVSIRLPRGAKVLIRFPSKRGIQRVICVPDREDGDLLAYMYPYPLEVQWALMDEDGEEADPSNLSTGALYYLETIAVMSDETWRVIPHPRIVSTDIAPTKVTPTQWVLQVSSPGARTVTSDEDYVGTQVSLWSRLGLTEPGYAYFLSPGDFEVTVPPPLVLEFS